MNWQIAIMFFLLMLIVIQAIAFAHFRIPLPMNFKVEVWEDPFTGHPDDPMHYTVCVEHPNRPQNLPPGDTTGRILVGDFTNREDAELQAAALRVFLATGNRIEPEMVI